MRRKILFAGDLGGGEWQRAGKEVRDDHKLGEPHLPSDWVTRVVVGLCHRVAFALARWEDQRRVL